MSIAAPSFLPPDSHAVAVADACLTVAGTPSHAAFAQPPPRV